MPQVPFSHQLVLNQSLLGVFKVKGFEELPEAVRYEALEGLVENNVIIFTTSLSHSSSTAPNCLSSCCSNTTRTSSPTPNS
jgi:hypothetical protein